jgi:hypothetical protein
MSLEELSAMYDPDTMDFDEFVRTYINNNTTPRSIREEQDLAYEQSLAQDRAKKIPKIHETIPKIHETIPKIHETIDDPKPTLAELRQLRLAKLAPEVKPLLPDYTKLTVVELKKLCKERGLKGFTGKCKQELINLL